MNWWVALALLGGASQPDPRLANYQWTTTPRAGWGAEALAGHGRLAGGMRVWRTSSDQDLGVAGAPSVARVSRTSLEALGEWSMARGWGSELLAVGSAGWVHLAYQPDQVVFVPGGSGPAITVAFEPIDEWIAGLGLAARRPLAGAWSLGLEAGVRVFGLDTAHRNGSAIELSRETFSEWNARARLAWLHRMR